MHLFFSQTKCAVLQKLADYYNCEVEFQKEDGYKIKNEIQGLINNLQVMKSVIDECNVYANIKQDELQCVFVFADAQMLRRRKNVQYIRTLVPLGNSTTLFVGQN